MLLTVQNLSIDFVNHDRMRLPVVSLVSFHVDRGEILALVGESGCGKSASCHSLTGLLPSPPAFPRADAVLFDDGSGPVDLFRISRHELRKIRGGGIAYVFQEPSASLNPVFRVGDQIAEVLMLHRPEITDRKTEVIHLLKQVGIPAPESRAEAFPHELSGGMQQRIMIAMALAGNPSLLIADEPTTALDVTIQAQILELLDDLRRKRNMAVILVTHNLGIVSQLADRTAVMYAGTIVETGPTRALLDSPMHPYTRALLAAVPRLGGEGGRLVTIPGTVPSPAEFPVGCRFCGRCQARGSLAERCAKERPEFQDMGNGRFCACHQVEVLRK